ncbi:MAG: PAS domain S-box protein [candidate division KSB1 bacterium]|nr:PAS domain S-box protein [candidate division KSB1 bacterium]
MSLLILVLITGLYLFKVSEERKFAVLVEQLAVEKTNLTKNFLELQSAPLRGLVDDYTYWDEMVRFIRTGDRKWANENITATLNNFRADFAWVFSKKLDLVYAENHLQPDSFFLPLLFNTSLHRIVEKGPFFHFFMDSPYGLVEIHGASVHPSSDPKHQTPPHGYFFIGKQWGTEFLQSFSERIGGNAAIHPPEWQQPSPKNSVQNYIITTTIPLLGWDGSRAAVLNVNFPIAVAQSLRRQADIQYSLIILFSVVIIEAVSFFIYLLIFRPLRMISQSLEEKDLKPIAKLLTKQNEFARLAQLVAEFFSQQEKLIKEINEHKTAVQALAESEKKYRNLVESLLDGVYKSTPDGRFIDVNQAMVKMLGYESKEELMAVDIQSQLYFQPQDRLSAVLQEKLEEMAVFRLRKKDGTEIWVEDHGRLVTDENGNVLYHEGILRDVTDRIHAEESLRQSREWMRILIEGSPEFFFYTQDAEGKVTYTSPSVEKITGYTVEEWQGQTHWFTTESDINRIARERTQAHLRGEDSHEPMYVEIMHAQGRPIILELAEHPVIRNGKVIGIQGLARDITQRVRAEKEQQEHLKRLQKQQEAIVKISTRQAGSDETLLDSLQFITEIAAEGIQVERCSIWTFDEKHENLICQDLYLLSENKHEHGLQLSSDNYPAYFEAVRRNRTVPISDARTDPRSAAFLDNYLIPHNIYSMLDAGIRISGKLVGVICFEHVGETRFWHEDEISFAAQISDQITQAILDDERRKVERALRNSIDEITILLKEVHHRVKNNLQIMSSLLNLQAARTTNQEVLAALRDAGSRIRSMALLHETLYRTGNMAQVNFAEYVEIICGVLVRTFGSSISHISIERKIPRITLNIDDAVSCGLIINELVSNAIKHAFPNRKHGKILVEFKKIRGTAELIVADDGIGLPPSFALNDQESLGLRLVQMMAEKLDGKLEFLTQGGTTVRIVFKADLFAA